MDLAEVDELIDELWRVRSFTDEYESDLLLATTLCGEGADVAPLLQTIGSDCVNLGRTLQHRADDLRSFRLATIGYGDRGAHANAVGDDHWRLPLGPSAFDGSNGTKGSSGEIGWQIYQGLIHLGVSPEDAHGIAVAIAHRDGWISLADIDVDLTDPDAFDPFSPAIMALAFPQLVAANELVRDHERPAGPRPVPGPGPGPRREPALPQNKLSEDDLIRIAENPALTGALAGVAALLLQDRAFLAALDGAGQRTGDVLGAQKITATDHVFSIDDLESLTMQRLVSIGLGPVKHEIDGIRSGEVDGTRSKQDFVAFAAQVRSSNPEIAELADLVVESGLFDRGGWDIAADWAANVGMALGALTVLVAVVGTGGVVLPALLAIGTGTAAGVEFVAGLKTDDVGHMVGGGVGIASDLVGLRVLLGLRAGAAGHAAGFTGDVLETVDAVGEARHVLQTSGELPTHSVTELDDLFGSLGFSAGDIDDIFAGGVRAAAGSAATFAPHLDSVTDNQVVTQLARPVATFAAKHGADTTAHLVDVVDEVIENSVGPAAAFTAARVDSRNEQRPHRKEDDDGSDGDRSSATPSRTPVPEPETTPTPASSSAAEANTTAPPTDTPMPGPVAAPSTAAGPAPTATGPTPGRTPTPAPVRIDG